MAWHDHSGAATVALQEVAARARGRSRCAATGETRRRARSELEIQPWRSGRGAAPMARDSEREGETRGGAHRVVVEAVLGELPEQQWGRPRCDVVALAFGR